MRKFLLTCAFLIALILTGNYFYYYTSYYLDLQPDAPISSFTKTEGKKILVDQGGGYQDFEIRGVDLGAGKPGYFATSFAITKEEYLRWFRQIQEMGANTIRVYTILSPSFYEAFLEYNQNREQPLFLIHGLWLNDYIQNSHLDAYDPEYLETFLENACRLVDVIHGRRKISPSSDQGSGTYRWDISQWVLGYILGVEWEDTTVVYTDHMRDDQPLFSGKYFQAAPEATPFENMLAQLGEKIVEYESGRFKQQRLIAFSNWPTTDPMDYEAQITQYFRKIAKVNVENIKTTNELRTGQFASYHVYPYFPDYLRYEEKNLSFTGAGSETETYSEYLRRLVRHHSMPVVISEFGVPSSRGMAHIDYGRSYNQGYMSEKDQGIALADCYQDIMDAGCAGSIIFTWQDEWFKRTWNTMHAVDLTQTAYWSDYQTNEQYFGLLSFDPGTDRSISYTDGDDEEWTDQDLVSQNGAFSLSMKYDEKFLYFLIRGSSSGPLYLPIDITPKTGALSCQNYGIGFDRPADFLIVLDGPENSRVLVQERYDLFRAMFRRETEMLDAYEFPPDKDSTLFNPIHLVLQISPTFITDPTNSPVVSYETGKLREGNANPNSPDFDSLADFCRGNGFIEVKLPWQLLNFSNPSDMEIHDDYYLHYGVEDIRIRRLYAGVGTGEQTIPLGRLKLKRWGNRVTYHERLKTSYYMMQEVWAEGEK